MERMCSLGDREILDEIGKEIDELDDAACAVRLIDASAPSPRWDA